MRSESQEDLSQGTGGRRSPTAHPLPRILLCGETALSVEFGDDIHPSINGRVHALSQALRELGHPGILELNPTYRSLFVQYDPWEISHEQLLIHIEGALTSTSEKFRRPPDVVEIPVCYGGELGPDLEGLAAARGLTSESAAALHASPVYDVVMVGFTPGFPYLSGLDSRLITPRKEVPRKVVPAGSVGIADRQTGIYSMDSPGGWQIIGRTPLRIFDLGRSDPFLVKPGDRLRFTPITRDAFESLAHS